MTVQRGGAETLAFRSNIEASIITYNIFLGGSHYIYIIRDPKALF